MAEQPTEKTCTKCGETKPLEEYAKSKLGAQGRAAKCKPCKRQQYHDNRDHYLTKAKEQYQSNREAILARKRRWRDENRDRVVEQSRRYYEQNKEEILAKQKEYYWATRKDRLAASRRWREENKVALAEEWNRRAAEWRRRNPEKRKEVARAYYQRNPHKQWQAKYLSRVRTFGLPIVMEDFTKDDVIAKYGDHCAYCETGEFENLDHYIPVKAGGPHTLENVRPSCAGCNNAKRDSDPEEWLAEQAEFDALTEDEQNALIDAEIAKYLNE